jgi:multicomponent Na+:H+ antiporter subunit E
MIARAALIAWLVALWLILWRDVSYANLASGLAIAVAISTIHGQAGDRHSPRVRPLALLAFLGFFAWKLLEANLILAREILTRRDTTRTGIIAVPLTPSSDLVITLVANAVSLTPGTLTVEVGDDPPILYIHVLHLYDLERVRQDIWHLERLARRAAGYDLPVPSTQPRGKAGQR